MLHTLNIYDINMKTHLDTQKFRFLWFTTKLEYSRNIPGYSNINLARTFLLLIWNMEISQKIFETSPPSFFGISWNIGIFHFQYGTYKWSKIWDKRQSGIFKKNPGHKKTGKRWNTLDFWNIPLYSILEIRDMGGA